MAEPIRVDDVVSVLSSLRAASDTVKGHREHQLATIYGRLISFCSSDIHMESVAAGGGLSIFASHVNSTIISMKIKSAVLQVLRRFAAVKTTDEYRSTLGVEHNVVPALLRILRVLSTPGTTSKTSGITSTILRDSLFILDAVISHVKIQPQDWVETNPCVLLSVITNADVPDRFINGRRTQDLSLLAIAYRLLALVARHRGTGEELLSDPTILMRFFKRISSISSAGMVSLDTSTNNARAERYRLEKRLNILWTPMIVYHLSRNPTKRKVLIEVGAVSFLLSALSEVVQQVTTRASESPDVNDQHKPKQTMRSKLNENDPDDFQAEYVTIGPHLLLFGDQGREQTVALVINSLLHLGSYVEGIAPPLTLISSVETGKQENDDVLVGFAALLKGNVATVKEAHQSDPIGVTLESFGWQIEQCKSLLRDSVSLFWRTLEIFYCSRMLQLPLLQLLSRLMAFVPSNVSKLYKKRQLNRQQSVASVFGDSSHASSMGLINEGNVFYDRTQTIDIWLAAFGIEITETGAKSIEKKKRRALLWDAIARRKDIDTLGNGNEESNKIKRQESTDGVNGLHVLVEDSVEDYSYDDDSDISESDYSSESQISDERSRTNDALSVVSLDFCDDSYTMRLLRIVMHFFISPSILAVQDPRAFSDLQQLSPFIRSVPMVRSSHGFGVKFTSAPLFYLDGVQYFTHVLTLFRSGTDAGRLMRKGEYIIGFAGDKGHINCARLSSDSMMSLMKNNYKLTFYLFDPPVISIIEEVCGVLLRFPTKIPTVVCDAIISFCTYEVLPRQAYNAKAGAVRPTSHTGDIPINTVKVPDTLSEDPNEQRIPSEADIDIDIPSLDTDPAVAFALFGVINHLSSFGRRSMLNITLPIFCKQIKQYAPALGAGTLAPVSSITIWATVHAMTCCILQQVSSSDPTIAESVITVLINDCDLACICGLYFRQYSIAPLLCHLRAHQEIVLTSTGFKDGKERHWFRGMLRKNNAPSKRAVGVASENEAADDCAENINPQALELNTDPNIPHRNWWLLTSNFPEAGVDTSTGPGNLNTTSHSRMNSMLKMRKGLHNDEIENRNSREEVAQVMALPLVRGTPQLLLPLILAVHVTLLCILRATIELGSDRADILPHTFSSRMLKLIKDDAMLDMVVMVATTTSRWLNKTTKSKSKALSSSYARLFGIEQRDVDKLSDDASSIGNLSHRHSRSRLSTLTQRMLNHVISSSSFILTTAAFNRSLQLSDFLWDRLFGIHSASNTLSLLIHTLASATSVSMAETVSQLLLFASTQYESQRFFLLKSNGICDGAIFAAADVAMQLCKKNNYMTSVSSVELDLMDVGPRRETKRARIYNLRRLNRPEQSLLCNLSHLLFSVVTGVTDVAVDEYLNDDDDNTVIMVIYNIIIFLDGIDESDVEGDPVLDINKLSRDCLIATLSSSSLLWALSRYEILAAPLAGAIEGDVSHTGITILCDILMMASNADFHTELVLVIVGTLSNVSQHITLLHSFFAHPSSISTLVSVARTVPSVARGKKATRSHEDILLFLLDIFLNLSNPSAYDDEEAFIHDNNDSDSPRVALREVIPWLLDTLSVDFHNIASDMKRDTARIVRRLTPFKRRDMEKRYRERISFASCGGQNSVSPDVRQFIRFNITNNPTDIPTSWSPPGSASQTALPSSSSSLSATVDEVFRQHIY